MDEKVVKNKQQLIELVSELPNNLLVDQVQINESSDKVTMSIDIVWATREDR